MASKSLKQLALHTIGGGWGSESADETNNVRVRVIRGTDIPRLRVGDFSSVPVRYESSAKVENRLLKPGDLVIEVSGGSAASGQHTGRALFITQRIIDALGGTVIPASFCRLLRLDAERVDPRFVVYQIDSLHLSGEISEFENQSTGIANFQFSRFIEETFPYIEDLQSQSSIAQILGTLDDKIELNRKQNETLEAMARALFKAWFVDFEPVRAKMEGRWQRGQSLPGLPAHLYDLFPDRLVESELGEIPEGWGVGKLGDVAVNPRRSVQPNQIDEGTPYIALEHMPKRCIALAEWGMADGLESNKYEFKRGEILFGKLRPYFHKVGVAPVDGVCSTDIVVIAPKLPIWFGFVLAHASSDAFVEYTNAGSTGTKMPRTSWTDMARYAVAMPSDDVASAFNLYIHAISEEIIARIHESKSLAQLRDNLLPKLIEGSLRVRDPESIIGSSF